MDKIDIPFSMILNRLHINYLKTLKMKTLTIHTLLLFFLSCTALQSQITYQSAFPNIGFEFPTEIQNANDGSNRLFVVEQRGRIKGSRLTGPCFSPSIYL